LALSIPESCRFQEGGFEMLAFIRSLMLLSLICAPALSFAAGAIAVDDDEGDAIKDIGYGIATDEPSREAAAEAAMRKCRATGNKGCKVVVRFDKCGAYAADRKSYGVGWGNSEGAAKKRALDQCGDSCKIVVSDCE
jgi:hypothetical protein